MVQKMLCWLGFHSWRKLELGDYMIHNYIDHFTNECGVCFAYKTVI